jgi:hypothetical protein
MAHAFSEKALKTYEDDMIGHIRLFYEKLKESKEPINVSNWCSYLTADILGDLCFGKSFGMLEREENRFVVKVMVESARLALIVSPCQAPTLTLFNPLLRYFTDAENRPAAHSNSKIRHPKNPLLRPLREPPPLPRLRHKASHSTNLHPRFPRQERFLPLPHGSKESKYGREMDST